MYLLINNSLKPSFFTSPPQKMQIIYCFISFFNKFAPNLKKESIKSIVGINHFPKYITDLGNLQTLKIILPMKNTSR